MADYFSLLLYNHQNPRFLYTKNPIYQEVDMANIIGFLGTKIIFLIIALIVLMAVMILLFIIQRNLKKKITFKEEIQEKGSDLINEIENLRALKESPESILRNLSTLTRNFFAEEFKISKNLDYAELIEIFRQRSKPMIVSFCQKMLEALYSGEKLETKELNSLIDNFQAIVSEVHPTQKPRRLLEKQTTQKILEKIPQSMPEIRPMLSSTFTSTENYLPALIKPLAKKPQTKKELSIKEQLSISEENLNKKLTKMNSEQIADVYNHLQKLYNEAYSAAEKRKDEESIKKLEEFKDVIMEKINEYTDKPSYSTEFTNIITKGMQILIKIKYAQ